jgi:hypothetical protein
MGAVLNNLAEFRTGRKGFIAFTLDFAAMAADTFLSILKQVVVAHNISPHQTALENEELAQEALHNGLKDDCKGDHKDDHKDRPYHHSFLALYHSGLSRCISMCSQISLSTKYRFSAFAICASVGAWPVISETYLRMVSMAVAI